MDMVDDVNIFETEIVVNVDGNESVTDMPMTMNNDDDVQTDSLLMSLQQELEVQQSSSTAVVTEELTLSTISFPAIESTSSQEKLATNPSISLLPLTPSSHQQSSNITNKLTTTILRPIAASESSQQQANRCSTFEDYLTCFPVNTLRLLWQHNYDHEATFQILNTYNHQHHKFHDQLEYHSGSQAGWAHHFLKLQIFSTRHHPPLLN
jgi:hypothetical protein